MGNRNNANDFRRLIVVSAAVFTSPDFLLVSISKKRRRSRFGVVSWRVCIRAHNYVDGYLGYTRTIVI